jgi:hypothetical protein
MEMQQTHCLRNRTVTLLWKPNMWQYVCMYARMPLPILFVICSYVWQKIVKIYPVYLNKTENIQLHYFYAFLRIQYS